CSSLVFSNATSTTAIYPLSLHDALPICRWLEQTSLGAGVRESLWLFPAIETLHLLGMAALVGTTAVFDFRLLGWMLRRERVSERSEEHTSELQSRGHLVCRLLLEKKKER